MSDAPTANLTPTPSSRTPEVAVRTGIRHVELWTAVVILVGTIGSGAAAVIDNFRPVRTALESKPLEGIWDMTLDYDLFHGETGTWSGKGKALIVWQRAKQRYDIYFGVAIRMSGDLSPMLAGFSNGFIAADEEGWPERNFSIENIEWIARAHVERKEPSKAYYEYTGCVYTASGSRADRIEGAFKTPVTNGVMKLTWVSPLN